MSGWTVAGLMLGWILADHVRHALRARERRRRIASTPHGPCSDCTVIRCAAANGIELRRRPHTCPEGNSL